VEYCKTFAKQKLSSNGAAHFPVDRVYFYRKNQKMPTPDVLFNPVATPVRNNHVRHVIQCLCICFLAAFCANLFASAPQLHTFSVYGTPGETDTDLSNNQDSFDIDIISTADLAA
jgi:hypothetical protein